MNSTRGDLSLPGPNDPLTFGELDDLERQLEKIVSNRLRYCEWQNVVRLMMTVRRYRETNDPRAVNASLPQRTTIDGVDYLPARRCHNKRLRDRQPIELRRDAKAYAKRMQRTVDSLRERLMCIQNEVAKMPKHCVSLRLRSLLQLWGSDGIAQSLDDGNHRHD